MEKDVMNAQLYAPQQYLEVLLQSRRTLREIRQGVVQADTMLENGDADAVHEALHSLLSKLSALNGGLVCDNPYLNEVITYYSAKFQKNHIPFTIDMDLGIVELPVAEVCLILNNALKNALEASLNLPEAQRSVRIQATPRQRQFLMRVTNSFDGRLTLRNGLPQSTKQGQGHGYGVTSIRAAAVGAGWDMVFHVKEKKTFILDARVRAVSAKKDMTRQ